MMFHVKHPNDQAASSGRLLLPADSATQLTVTDSQVEQLQRYAAWLESEAIPAGGIGPNEAMRIWDRHVIDALAYAIAEPPRPRAIDVGTGAGLPGIPLAIITPNTKWTLLDRSQRRIDLVRRAIRILRLDNVETSTTALGEANARLYPYAVSRAVLPLEAAAREMPRVLEPEGVAVVGIHRGDEPPTLPTTPQGVSAVVRSVRVLDARAWFLIMRTSSS
jgi:16S rRNA (guanine527-N7)-methyltransferase